MPVASPGLRAFTWLSNPVQRMLPFRSTLLVRNGDKVLTESGAENRPNGNSSQKRRALSYGQAISNPPKLSTACWEDIAGRAYKCIPGAMVVSQAVPLSTAPKMAQQVSPGQLPFRSDLLRPCCRVLGPFTHGSLDLTLMPHGPRSGEANGFYRPHFRVDRGLTIARRLQLLIQRMDVRKSTPRSHDCS
jgi:hypothetical protein